MVREYIYQNKKIVLGLLMCILIGTMAGFAVYNFSDKEVKNVLVKQMTESIETAREDFIKTDVIYNGVKNNICYIFFMLVFSIMLYGTILIYFIYIIK